VEKPHKEIDISSKGEKDVTLELKDIEPAKNEDGNKKSTFEKFKEIIQKGSLVSVGFGGRALKDDYFIWLIFTLGIVLLVAIKLVQDFTTIG
jgi:hypothetical protein